MDMARKEVYYNGEYPGSHGEVHKLFGSAKKAGAEKVRSGRVKQFLADQQRFSLHKPARRDFKLNATYVKGINWQQDLADIKALSRDNKGHKFIITVRDIFSKRAWAITIKTKSRKEMLTAFQQLFKATHHRKAARLQTDAGHEFLKKDLQGVLKREGLPHSDWNRNQKADVVERFNRTLKSRIWTNREGWHADLYSGPLLRIARYSPPRVLQDNHASLWHREFGVEL